MRQKKRRRSFWAPRPDLVSRASGSAGSRTSLINGCIIYSTNCQSCYNFFVDVIHYGLSRNGEEVDHRLRRLLRPRREPSPRLPPAKKRAAEMGVEICGAKLSFDQFVGGRKQQRRNLEAEGPGGLEIMPEEPGLTLLHKRWTAERFFSK
jgi:hypothetical protein